MEKDERLNKEKLDRLLNLYLEGNIPQASYVVKSSELKCMSSLLRTSGGNIGRKLVQREPHTLAKLFESVFRSSVPRDKFYSRTHLLGASFAAAILLIVSPYDNHPKSHRDSTFFAASADCPSGRAPAGIPSIP